jgi:hypothetical protein
MSYELIQSRRGRIIFQKGEPTSIEPASMSHSKEIQMKGNIKKLAIFVMMAAIAIFMAAATASAGDQDWKTIGDGHGNAIVGEYAYTGVNSCITSPAGFTDQFKALGPVIFGVGTLQGIFTFKPHGKGTVTARQVSVAVPPGSQLIPPSPNFASANSSNTGYDFTYNVTHDGAITLEMVPGTGSGMFLTGPNKDVTWEFVGDSHVSLSGLISKDHKTMTLGAVEPAVWILRYSNSSSNTYSICGTWRFLTRLEELHK